MKSRKFLGSCFAFGLAFFIQTGQSAQTAGKSDDDQKTGNQTAAPQQRETLAKPLTEKERKRREAKLKKELETPYRKWLHEDVVYIITDEETQGLQAPPDRRRARAVHRAVLAAARSDAGYGRERI